MDWCSFPLTFAAIWLEIGFADAKSTQTDTNRSYETVCHWSIFDYFLFNLAKEINSESSRCIVYWCTNSTGIVAKQYWSDILIAGIDNRRPSCWMAWHRRAAQGVPENISFSIARNMGIHWWRHSRTEKLAKWRFNDLMPSAGPLWLE